MGDEANCQGKGEGKRGHADLISSKRATYSGLRI
jgi:hypothetical protein